MWLCYGESLLQLRVETRSPLNRCLAPPPILSNAEKPALGCWVNLAPFFTWALCHRLPKAQGLEQHGLLPARGTNPIWAAPRGYLPWLLSLQVSSPLCMTTCFHWHSQDYLQIVKAIIGSWPSGQKQSYEAFSWRSHFQNATWNWEEATTLLKLRGCTLPLSCHQMLHILQCRGQPYTIKNDFTQNDNQSGPEWGKIRPWVGTL